MPITNDGQTHNVAAIRELLRASFWPQELRRFCQDRAVFRPIVVSFSPAHGLDEMIDHVIDYCEIHLLFDELLAEVKLLNPRQYVRFEHQLALLDAAPVELPVGSLRKGLQIDELRVFGCSVRGVAVLLCYLLVPALALSALFYATGTGPGQWLIALLKPTAALTPGITTVPSQTAVMVTPSPVTIVSSTPTATRTPTGASIPTAIVTPKPTNTPKAKPTSTPVRKPTNTPPPPFSGTIVRNYPHCGGYAGVTGHVFHGNGAPYAGAAVGVWSDTWQGRVGVSEADGKYDVPLTDVPPGHFRVAVVKLDTCVLLDGQPTAVNCKRLSNVISDVTVTEDCTVNRVTEIDFRGP
jgi:hypothetical protein